MSEVTAKVSVSKGRIGEFSLWSGDHNRADLDEIEARSPLFKQTTSAQLLSLIAIDEALSTTPVGQGQCVRIDAQFHHFVVPGTAYDLSITHEHASNLYQSLLVEEDGDAFLNATWTYGEAAKPLGSPAWFGSVTKQARGAIGAIEIPDEGLTQGAQFSAVYPANPQGFNAQEGLLSEAHRRILALCNHLVGNDMADRRSLLTGLNIEFFDATDIKPRDSLTYRALVEHFDPQLRTLSLALEVCGPDGSILARGKIAVYVRAALAPSSIEAIRSAGINLDSLQNLSGQVAVVTGASRGLGADLATALSLSGCMVYAACRHRTEQVNDLEASLHAAGAKIEFIIGDVGNQDWCEQLRVKLDAEQQRVGVLVLNASEPPIRRLLGVAAADGLEYISRNLRLVAQPLDALLPDLHATGGALIAISCEQVAKGQRGFSDFVALKQASESLAQGAYHQSGNIGLLIARPPAIRNSWNDSPAAVGTVISVLQAAISIVRSIDKSLASKEIDYLEDFPELAVAKILSPLPLTICCSFTADPLLPAIERWAALAGRQAVTTVAPYHQVLQQLLDPASQLAVNPGKKVLFLRHSDWLRERSADELDNFDFLKTFLNELTDELIEAFDAYLARANEKLFVFLCPWFHKDRLHKDRLHKDRFDENSELAQQLAECELRLWDALATRTGIHVVHPASLAASYGVDANAIFDPLRNEIGHIPYQTGYYDALASMMIRVIHAEGRGPIKVVVVDCDDTLWNGVVGEVGPDGVTFEPQHLALQQRLADLTDAGVLVALCSKNEEADVWSVFEQRGGEMPLEREQIVGAMINWQPKSQNIQTLATQLNLGLDSFAFIDDNPVQCAEVRANCPGVLTLRWPTNGEEAQIFVDHVWELDVPTSTAEDRNRTAMYKQEFKRQAVRDEAQSFDKFIEGLGLEIDIRPLDESDIPRASQLTTRTNQFNFTTRRRDEAEMRTLMNDTGFQCRTVRVGDRFGDYGLVGLLLVAIDATAPRIDTFLLSCRVLGRGVEHAMLAEAGRLVSQAGGENVAVELFRTERNTPALNFLKSVLDEGFLNAGGEGIQANVPALTLVGCVYEPTAGSVATDEASTDAGATFAEAAIVDVQPKRGREDQIAATLQMTQMAMSSRQIEEGPISTVDASNEDAVLQVFSKFLDQKPAAIREIDKLEELGCDSLMIVEITVALRKQFPDLPATLLFEHPSVVSIIEHIDGTDTPEQIAKAGRRRVAGKSGAQGEQMIAVTGMAIRCGGATSLQEFEAMLRDGRDAVVQVDPEARDFLGEFDGGPYFASLIDDAARFDAEFFNIIPREATYMDPQARQFLEVAWSALEDAGLAGSRRDPETGVYVGLMYGEYRAPANAQARREGSPLRSWEAFSLANRLSQFMKFTGPSFAIDTACSSSGTAVHLACKALASGECRTALVGGVNLAVDPDRFRQLNKLGILSPDGLCRPFGDTANGTVLGEGVGSVVLRRLEDAVEAGDRIYGLIRGSALSVGAGSVGFTAPNPVAQSIAIAEAIADADVDPRSVSYVECHGTGTALGDPIEVRGIELAYRNQHLWHEHTQGDQRISLGSVKANVGHLEAGAGIVSLIKVLLQLDARTLFPTLSSDQPNPQIPLDKLGYRVQRECEPWKPAQLVVDGTKTTMPLRAGVNSFGVGGSNVHMIVEEYVAPALAESLSPEPSAQVLPLSATSSEALARQAVALRRALAESSPTRLGDFCYSMATGRPQLPVRASIAAQNVEQLIEGLEKLSDPVRNRKVRSPEGGQLVGLFSGQGSQYTGMGAGLYKTSKVFRETIDECAAYIDGFRDHSLRKAMFETTVAQGAELIHQTAYTQPALFALEVGLFRYFCELGVKPTIVCGHSVGEISALCAAGGVSLQDGLRLIEARGRLMQELTGDCGMLAAAITEADARLLVVSHSAEVSIAAINGPESIVLAGSNSILTELAAQLEARSIKTTALKVSHGFHSPQMAGMLDTYRETIRSISFQEPEIPIVSCVSGSLLGDELYTEEYWMQQVRQPVQYFRAISGIAESGNSIFMEFGPQPVLLGMARRFINDSNQRWVASLQPRQPDDLATMGTIGELFEAGAAIDWSLVAGSEARRIKVPPYRFSDTQFWLDSIEPGSIAPPPRKRTSALVTEPANYRLEWKEKSLPEDLSSQPCSIWWLAEPSTSLFSTGAESQPKNLQLMSDDSCWDALRLALDAGEVDRVVLVFDAVASAFATDAEGDSALLRANLNSLLRALKIIVEADSAAKLFVCTAGTSPVIRGLSEASPVDSALWAAARNIALEHPDNWGGSVCRGAAGSAWLHQLERLVRLDCPDEQWLCGKQGQLYVPRLVPVTSVTVDGSTAIDPDSTCLVLGGQGAIGLAMAQWLFERGARRLVLTGRTAAGLGEGAKILAAQMAKVDGVVEFEQMDMSSPTDVDKLFDKYSSGLQRIGAVVHCAGVDDVEPVLQTSAEVIERQFGAKVVGGMALRNQIEQVQPDLVILNSSISAVLGSQGRTVYAAANGYLDGLAEVLAAQDIRTISVQWGPWGGGGLASQDSLAQLERMGNHALAVEPAMQCLERALQAGLAQVTVVAMDWPKFRSVFEMRRERPVLSELGLVLPNSAVQDLPASVAPWLQQLAKVTEGEQRPLLLGLLQGAIQSLLGHSEVESIDCEQPFAELGIDSLLAIELAASIEEGLGEFPSDVIFDYPSVEELTDFLIDEYLKNSGLGNVGTNSVRQSVATVTSREDLQNIVVTQAAEVLGVPSAGQLDISLSFSELGLDSLLMVELAGRLESALDADLTLSDLFEQSSIADAVSYIEQLLPSATALASTVVNTDGSAPKPHAVLGYEPELAGAFADFTRIAWPDRDPNLASARFQWMFVDSAQRTDATPVIWRIEDSGNIVAFQGAMPVLVKLGNQTRCLPWLMDSMVLPAYRQQAFGARILMAAREEFPLNLSLGQSDAMRAMQDRLNWQKVCVLSSYVLPLRTSDMLGNKVNKPLQLLYSAGARLSFQARRFTRARSHDLKAVEIKQFDKRFDDLWETLSPQFECAVVRDSSYLNWKYIEQPGQNYLSLSFEDFDDNLCGYAVVKIQEPSNTYAYRRATVIDLLAPFSEEAIVFAMLDEIRNRALGQGASAIQFHLSHTTLERAVRRYGFFNRGISEQFRISIDEPETGDREMLLNGKNWLITMGDSDFDRPDPSRSET